MSGPMSGTPISDLHNMQQTQYNSMHNYQHEQGHNAAHQMSQTQHVPYYNTSNCSGYPPQQNVITYPPNSAPHHPDINVINNTNDENIAVNEINDAGVYEDTFDSVSEDESVISFIPKHLREPLILFIIYMILSQGAVQLFLSKYVVYLRPGIDGRVGTEGVIIYAVFLVGLFMLAKKFIL